MNSESRRTSFQPMQTFGRLADFLDETSLHSTLPPSSTTASMRPTLPSTLPPTLLERFSLAIKRLEKSTMQQLTESKRRDAFPPIPVVAETKNPAPAMPIIPSATATLPFPQMKEFLTPEDLHRYEMTSDDVDRLALLVGTFAAEIKTDVLFSLAEAWRALQDMLGTMLHVPTDARSEAATFRGDPDRSGQTAKPPVPVALLFKVWLAFLHAAINRLPLSITELPHTIQGIGSAKDYALAVSKTVWTVPESSDDLGRASSRRSLATTIPAGTQLSATHVVNAMNELQVERKAHVATQRRLVEMENRMADLQRQLKSMQRIHGSTTDLEKQHEVIANFNFLPMQLVDALSRLHATSSAGDLTSSELTQATAEIARLTRLAETEQAGAASRQDDVISLRQKLASAYDVNANLEQRMADIEASYRNAVTDLDAKSLEMQQLRDRMGMMEREREPLYEAKRKLGAQVTLLTEENSKLLRDKLTLQTEKDFVEEEMATARHRLAMMQQTFDVASGGSDSSRQEKEGGRRAFELALERQHRLVAQGEERLGQLHTLAQRAQGSNLPSLRRTLHTEMQKARRELEALSEQCEQDIRGIQDMAVRMLREMEAALLDEKQKREADATRNAAVQGSLRANITTLERRIATLTSDLTSAQREIRDEQEKRAQAESDRDAMAANVEAMRSECLALTAERDDAVQRYEEVRRTQDRIVQLLTDLQARTAEVQNLERQLGESEAARDVLKQDKVDLEVRLAEAGAEHERAASREAIFKSQVETLLEKVDAKQKELDEARQALDKERQLLEESQANARKMNAELVSMQKHPDFEMADRFRKLVSLSQRVRRSESGDDRPPLSRTSSTLSPQSSQLLGRRSSVRIHSPLTIPTSLPEEISRDDVKDAALPAALLSDTPAQRETLPRLPPISVDGIASTVADLAPPSEQPNAAHASQLFERDGEPAPPAENWSRPPMQITREYEQDDQAIDSDDPFDTFAPLIAEVDDRGTYRIHLPAGCGQWHVSQRGLLTVRNVAKSFPGLLLPKLPGAAPSSRQDFTMGEDYDRPNLPRALPIHAFVKMEREPSGLVPWMEAHLDRRSAMSMAQGEVLASDIERARRLRHGGIATDRPQSAVPRRYGSPLRASMVGQGKNPWDDPIDQEWMRAGYFPPSGRLAGKVMEGGEA